MSDLYDHEKVEARLLEQGYEWRPADVQDQAAIIRRAIDEAASLMEDERCVGPAEKDEVERERIQRHAALDSILATLDNAE